MIVQRRYSWAGMGAAVAVWLATAAFAGAQDADPVPPPPEPAEFNLDAAAAVGAAKTPTNPWISLGSLDPGSGYQMLVTLSAQGGTIARIELNDPRYRELSDRPEDAVGYLGHLHLSDPGLVIQVVGSGTPAEQAGLRVGDLLHQVGETKIEQPDDVEAALAGTTAGDEITLQATRDGEKLNLTATLAPQPMQVVRPAVVGFRGQETKHPKRLKPFSFSLTPFRVKGPEHGDLGYPTLSATDDGSGVRLEAVHRDTALAKAGLKKNDVIQKIGGQDIAGTKDYWEALVDKSPGEKVNVSYARQGTVASVDVTLQSRTDLLSTTAADAFTEGAWELTHVPTISDPVVEFSRTLRPEDDRALYLPGAVRFIKRFRLEPAGDRLPGYHLRFDIEIENESDDQVEVRYWLDGPTGLPDEGWWYSYKVHPTYLFSAAGTRDVIWNGPKQGHTVYSATDIVTQHQSGGKRRLPIAENDKRLLYCGVDAIYFNCSLLSPQLLEEAEVDPEQLLTFDPVYARVVGEVYESVPRRSDVTFQLVSGPVVLPPRGAKTQAFAIYAGPKAPEIMEPYGLGDTIVYGWFWFFAVPLLWVLHFFEGLIGSYSVAIILLTVLVRLAMHPISRRMILATRKQHELAPEVEAIKKKHADDMAKQTEEIQALWNRHGVNPLMGCLMMPLQLPIFIGLYRALAVDVQLRGAPLIPGVSSWASNLSGPDQLWYWQPYLEPLGAAFLVGDDGFLGPYFNVLPLLTMVLFVVQSKLFQPPATDEQQEMTQNMMTFAMIFMGFAFFRVASGLCLYFIVSSAWGIGERYYLDWALQDESPPPAETTGGDVERKKTTKRDRKR